MAAGAQLPAGAFGSTFLGLLGEVSDKLLASPRYRHAKAGETVGVSGVEAQYDKYLNGGFDRAHLRVDSMGRVVGPLQATTTGKSRPTLQLTIDARVQRAADKALQHGIALARANGHADAGAAAAVVMDPRTGAVIALASTPTFNQVAATHDPQYLAGLYKDTGNNPRLLNQATQGMYPTGSTFKPIVAAAALSEGLITPWSPLLCSGSFTLGGYTFRNVEAGVYSSMSLPTALAESCDTWFYRLGDLFYAHGSQGIQRWAKWLGLGHPTGFDVPGEAHGIVPTPAWLLRNYNQTWYEGQTINLSIGQGYLAVTPLQLAVAYSALAKGNRRPAARRRRDPPRRLGEAAAVQARRQGQAEGRLGDPAGPLHGDALTRRHVDVALLQLPRPVAGKTGTAEAGAGRSDHSWYASWAPADNPRFVVVVLVAHGGFGAEAAAPAARDIYQALFNLKRWKPTTP